MLVTVTGIALVFFANAGVLVADSTPARVVESVGIAMAGFAPIRLIIYASERTGTEWRRKYIRRVCRYRVERAGGRKVADLPVIIAADIEGCITPPERSMIDLSDFARLRAYGDFARDQPQYPPLVLFTGRSQGYVELMAQSLGLIDASRDVPFVIENGAALYFPHQKRTLKLITEAEEDEIREVYSYLKSIFVGREFEPKSYMVTINPGDGEPVEQLFYEVKQQLEPRAVNVTHSASAVDVTLDGYSKLEGLKAALEQLTTLRNEAWAPLWALGAAPTVDDLLSRTVAIGDSPSDIEVLGVTGRAYSTDTGGGHPQVTEVLTVARPASGLREGVILHQKHIGFVIEAIQRECGIRIIRPDAPTP